MIVVGLMSGTSADGIDAALVQTDGEQQFRLIDFQCLPYEQHFRMRLLDCAQRPMPEGQIADLERDLTDLHVDAVATIVTTNNVTPDLVGMHGHTIDHRPAVGVTRQIGDGQRLATSTGTRVVYDFRSEDVRAGGQGAPLAPLFHAMLFSEQSQPCAVVNIGGVANVTWIDNDKIIAGDSGPGCGLLDTWIQSRTGEPIDHDGNMASRGEIDSAAVNAFQGQSYFARPFPKSADRFEFEPNCDHLGAADGAATFCEFTAVTIAKSIHQLGSPKTTWVTGGGSKHPVIMNRLKLHLGDVRKIDELGLCGDSLEAECFAWLAVRAIRGLPTSIPSTTGCNKPISGGQVAHV